MRHCVQALLLALGLFSTLPLHAEDFVSVIVRLDGPSVSQVNLEAATRPGPRLADTRLPGLLRRSEIASQHASLQSAVAPLGATITGRMLNTVNAVRVRIPASRLEDLARLPGVKGVHKPRLYHRQTASSVPWVGAPAAWSGIHNGTSLTGKGVRIGIIDSGIDYYHAAFGGSGKRSDYTNDVPTKIEPGTFPTAKVVGGWDFVGEDYDPGSFINNTPVPDPDPLDIASEGAEGHGSHVASIAAGLGVTKEGTPYRGSYTNLDTTQLAIGPGVAPGALLYALKVYGAGGTTDVVLDALDWAADPNQDGDTSDRLDVLVLSLGDYFGIDDPTDPEREAIDTLSRLGTVLAIAAGNDGNLSYIMSSPGVFPQPITVAASIDGGITEQAIQIDSPPDLAGRYGALEGAFTPKLAVLGPITGEIVATLPADACQALTNTNDLKGKIALVDRGGCFFADKIRAIQKAGALAVVVANNADGPPITMGSSGNASDIAIPGVMVSKADGKKIRDRLATSPVKVTLADGMQLAHPERGDLIEDYSSRGPAYRTQRLKPDIAAPGAEIYAAAAGSGTNGVVNSGTSMSTPHVGGAAALVREAHPDWPAEDIKAALMNTAVATHDPSGYPYPESLTGAGRLQVDQAALTPVIAKAASEVGEVSVSFGALEITAPIATNKTVRVVNHGASPVTLSLSVSNTVSGPGLRVVPAVPSVTVGAKATATFEVTLVADPFRLGRTIDPSSPSSIEGFPRQQIPESSGEIWLHGDGVAIHLPWYAIVRASVQFASTAATIGTATGSVARVTLPTRGTGGHAAPLVSVFQLGLTNTNQRFTDHRASTDVVAVGAATDYLPSGSIANTTLYFGIATAGHWISPQRAENDFDVEIDLNSDGSPDYTIINANSGTYNAGDVDLYAQSTEAQITVVRDEATGDLHPEWPINMLLPEEHDTAPFFNGAMVHAAQASDVGLTETQTRFRYRIITRGEYSDRTGWINFDAAKPLIDATPLGIKNTPFFDEGWGVAANLHREFAGTATTAKALLLHQHNIAGRAFDVVTLDLSTADRDGDGLPDAWELANFGDLSFGPTDDPDGDGFSNVVELARGHSPNKLRVLLSNTADVSLQWQGSIGRFYTVERAGTVLGPFVPVAQHLPGAAGTSAWHDPEVGSRPGPSFYRVRLE